MLAVAFILIFVVVYYIVRKRRAKKHGDLGQSLMEDADQFLDALHRPSASTACGAAAIVAESPVWLAPEIPPVQVEPSRVAAMASASSSSLSSFASLDESSLTSSSSSDGDDHALGPMSLCVLPKKSAAGPTKQVDDLDADDAATSPPEVKVWLAPVT
jgi:hypothetical protein